ncbi:peptidoglycan-binding domain-containing protein [Streptomyces sp. NPDC001787]|uniref:peptidoglycan-binding domain-containing protein n=1 Tax=Streptomyces sp. NPDC001787 TaxID=3154523 RepID=UPI0033332314
MPRGLSQPREPLSRQRRRGTRTRSPGRPSITEVVNLGLSTSQAKQVQVLSPLLRRGLHGRDRRPSRDRELEGHAAGSALLRLHGAVDGIVGTGTIKALQQYLKSDGFYSGAIDGIAGSGTRAAFAAWANQLCPWTDVRGDRGPDRVRTAGPLPSQCGRTGTAPFHPQQRGDAGGRRIVGGGFCGGESAERRFGGPGSCWFVSLAGAERKPGL